MSGIETVLRIQPGESAEDFMRRVADTAPQAPPDVLGRLRGLLRDDMQPLAETVTPAAHPAAA